MAPAHLTHVVRFCVDLPQLCEVGESWPLWDIVEVTKDMVEVVHKLVIVTEPAEVDRRWAESKPTDTDNGRFAAYTL